MSTGPKDPKIIEEHWSQINHPLEHLELISSENDKTTNDERGMLICNGSIQSITNSQLPILFTTIVSNVISFSALSMLLATQVANRVACRSIPI